MDLKLKDKVVLISGAAGQEGSIGHTILWALAEEGAIPAIVDRNARGFAYVEALQAQGIDAMFAPTDVTDPQQIEAAVAQVMQKYGRIDIVINNVGVNDGAGLDASYEDFVRSLQLNLVSYFLLVKHALPLVGCLYHPPQCRWGNSIESGLPKRPNLNPPRCHCCFGSRF